MKEPFDKLLEEKAALDRKFDRFVEMYHKAPPRKHFETHRYIDQARWEIDVLGHWIDSLQRTLDAAIAAGEAPAS